MGRKKIPLQKTKLKDLAVSGQIEQYVPKAAIAAFSDETYKPLGKLRIVEKDELTGEVIKRTHELDVKRIKSTIAGVIAAREKALAKPGGKASDGQITASAPFRGDACGHKRQEGPGV